MRFGAAFWVQRTGWPEIREAVAAAEEAGFDSLWVDDHLLTDEGPWEDDKLEGWTIASAMAAITSRATVGHLVTANTLRSPGLVAKMATTLDHVSGGRAVVGLGGGWFEREHAAFGVDFGTSIGERLDRLDEAAGLIRRLLDGERFSHAGRFYRFEDALARPRPVQPHVPILVGGSGRRKTLRTVARYADHWNAYGRPAQVADAAATLAAHCADVGRDPATIERSVSLNVIVRRSETASAAAWAAVARRHLPVEGENVLDLGGPPESVAAGLREYAAVGVDHAIWIFRAPFDLETIGRLAEVRALVDDA